MFLTPRPHLISPKEENMKEGGGKEVCSSHPALIYEGRGKYVSHTEVRIARGPHPALIYEGSMNLTHRLGSLEVG
jgi:hypothetical protein